MPTPALSRLKAVLLATILAVGGFGLPGYDLVAYHLGTAQHETQRPHYDLPGGCHGDHCPLGSLNPAPRLTSPLVAGLTVSSAIVDHAVPAPVAAPRTLLTESQPPSRAPPRLA
jgi:hypothetical protein